MNDDPLTFEEVYKMLGERDVLIYRLQKEVATLRANVPDDKPSPPTAEQDG